jgi:hypothetical protein
MYSKSRAQLPDRLLEAGVVIAILGAFYTLTGILG